MNGSIACKQRLVGCNSLRLSDFRPNLALHFGYGWPYDRLYIFQRLGPMATEHRMRESGLFRTFAQPAFPALP